MINVMMSCRVLSPEMQIRVATSQGNLIFLQGQGKVREFCKLVREILNTKKVREFHNFGPKYVVAGILTT